MKTFPCGSCLDLAFLVKHNNVRDAIPQDQSLYIFSTFQTIFQHHVPGGPINGHQCPTSHSSPSASTESRSLCVCFVPVAPDALRFPQSKLPCWCIAQFRSISVWPDCGTNCDAFWPFDCNGPPQASRKFPSRYS